MLETIGEKILGHELSKDDIKYLSPAILDEVYCQQTRMLEALLNEGYQLVIDDHLCVLANDGTTWNVAPDDYLTSHRIGCGIVLAPSITKLACNLKQDESIRNRKGYSIERIVKERELLMNVLDSWQIQGKISILHHDTISLVNSRDDAPVSMVVVDEDFIDDAKSIVDNIVNQFLGHDLDYENRFFKG